MKRKIKTNKELIDDFIYNMSKQKEYKVIVITYRDLEEESKFGNYYAGKMDEVFIRGMLGTALNKLNKRD